MMTRKPVLLVVDDDPDAVDLMRELLTEDGYEVVTAGSVDEAHEALEIRFVDLLLTDERLGRGTGTRLLQSARERVPSLGGILITGYADLECAVRAMRAGALDLLQKPLRKEALLAAVSAALAGSRLAREARYHRWIAVHDTAATAIVGSSPALRSELEKARLAAGGPATILIEGESGTGKELLAHAIHAWSPRHNGPFVAVNMGAIPDGLKEAELFGSRKGAFTGAVADRQGYFLAAEHGTLFLDEIGETSPDLQVRLLRALQEREVTQLGDTHPRKIDVRVLAATNLDLLDECRAGRFRQDLYYRLAVVKIALPPLRARLDDIEPLTLHFLEVHAHNLGKTIRGLRPEALAKLQRHRWSGNIRELNNVLERAAIFATDDWIGPELLVLDAVEPSPTEVETLFDQKFREAQACFERAYFERLLERNGGNKSAAAEEAGIDRSVLHAHLRKIGRAPE